MFSMRKRIAILTGAGMSVESGLSTFRGGNGMWDEYPVEQVATIEGYIANPSLVLEFYNKRRRELLTKEPNRGHRLIAELEKNYDVTVITQNVDDLHERAGSTNIIHLHGELMRACSSRAPHDLSQVGDIPADNPEIKIGDKAADGSQLRPFIVWFGEAVPEIERAALACQEAEVFVIIGTSLNVYPAAGLTMYVPPSAPIYLIDPKPVKWNSQRSFRHIMKGASEGMACLTEMLQGKAEG